MYVLRKSPWFHRGKKPGPGTNREVGGPTEQGTMVARAGVRVSELEQSADPEV